MALRPTNIRKWKPRLWAGWRPNGIGLQKPKHFSAMAKVALANRRHPFYAWKVLRNGVCDGCALGVAGFRDWTIDGVHLCTTRLELLSLNTGDAVPPRAFIDADTLASKSGYELRSMGRLGYPMRRRAGEAGFARISWEEAMTAVTDRLRVAGGDRTALFLTSRGITNEVYYVTGKAARALGVANVDSAARVCHAPSTVVLKEMIGAAATTCSFTDVIESDLVVLIGSNPANNQPVFMKYLYEAKRDHDTKVVVINPYLEPGLEKYWVPSSAESMIFGTKICDLHVPVRPGGDVALLNATLKQLIARGAVDRSFVAAHTTGWDSLEAELANQDEDELLRLAGVSRQQLDAFVDLYAQAKSAVLVWSMGITQRVEAADGVEAIVNLGLARGNVGRNGAGLMPIRGHSGVQGGGEMGAYATMLPGAKSVTPTNCASLEADWGFAIPHHAGLTAPEMLEAAERDELDVLYVSGGNFLDVLPDPPRVAAAMAKVPLRVHQDVVLTSQMLVAPDDGCEVIVLPTTTRYEQEGGGTETTTERRIVFSPHIAGHTVGEARSEWRIFADIAARTRPDLAAHFAWPSNQALREEIARVVPLYAGIETLENSGDNVQWGGRHLAADGQFPTPDGRASFRVVTPHRRDLPAGQFEVSTRRGKQFNSMVQASVDPLNGAHRDDILIDASDAAALGLAEGEAVVLRSDTGEYVGRLRFAKLPSQSLQVHWPEGNVLIASGPEHRDPRSHVPDYNARVTISPVEKAPDRITGAPGP